MPNSYKYSSPEVANIDYENIYFNSSDNHRLHAWHLKTKAKKVKGLVLFYHGNAQNLSAHSLSIQWITKYGYDVFIFDYRGYGLSQGKPHLEGVYQDGLFAFEKAKEIQKVRGAQKFVAMGQSLGGNVLMQVLPKIQDRGIDHVVLDSTFIDYKEIAFEKLKEVWITWPLSPLAYLLVSNSHSPEANIALFTRPTLVIHSKADRVIPYEMGREVYSKLTMKNKTFWTLENAPHISVYQIEKKKYQRELISLLDN
tara:strand:+ start:112563 stop:113324 length:762 start_codon:yes stop_codon:yes gene_type:complete